MCEYIYIKCKKKKEMILKHCHYRQLYMTMRKRISNRMPQSLVICEEQKGRTKALLLLLY